MSVHASAQAPVLLAFGGSIRLALLALTGVAIVAAAAATGGTRPDAIDPDLVIVIRAMAAIKGGLAAVAVLGCFWRLARPASPWRGLVYVASPPLMVAGTVALWNLQALGLAAIGLHLGLFAVLAAGLTDRDFIAIPSGRGRV